MTPLVRAGFPLVPLIRDGAAGRTSSTATSRRLTMYAQLTYFDRPHTPEELAAHEFAARERIHPAVSKLGHRFRVYVLQHDDGSRIIITIADSEQALLDAQKAIMSTELLPGEDPALLPGPDRTELYPVIDVQDVNPGSATWS
jgi:hypothetical protein